MGLDVTEMQGYREVEEQAGAGFGLLDRGTYHFKVDALGSDVLDPDTQRPRLQFGLVILDGDLAGRTHKEFLSWFASDQSASTKSFEEREKTVREIYRRTFVASRNPIGMINAIAGSPYAEEAALQDAISCIKGMDGTENPSDVAELMEALPNILDGAEFYGTITHSKDGERAYMRPVEYEVGEKKVGVTAAQPV
jgi:hypothetical protein